MRYFKIITDGVVAAIGTGNIGEEISDSEYIKILNLVDNCPDSPSGYQYVLTEDLNWKLCEMQDEPIEGEDMTETEMKAKGYDILVGNTR